MAAHGKTLDRLRRRPFRAGPHGLLRQVRRPVPEAGDRREGEDARHAAVEGIRPLLRRGDRRGAGPNNAEGEHLMADEEKDKGIRGDRPEGSGDAAVAASAPRLERLRRTAAGRRRRRPEAGTNLPPPGVEGEKAARGRPPARLGVPRFLDLVESLQMGVMVELGMLQGPDGKRPPVEPAGGEERHRHPRDPAGEDQGEPDEGRGGGPAGGAVPPPHGVHGDDQLASRRGAERRKIRMIRKSRVSWSSYSRPWPRGSCCRRGSTFSPIARLVGRQGEAGGGSRARRGLRRMLPVDIPAARQGGVAGGGQHLHHPGGEVQAPPDAHPVRAAGSVRGVLQQLLRQHAEGAEAAVRSVPGSSSPTTATSSRTTTSWRRPTR